ncbi:6-carboxytetrahydropterin synthase QueD [Sediminitomix flava]|nr:6-carboxytetrahydropterin synthase QueD [Sediminitomix flava]
MEIFKEFTFEAAHHLPNMPEGHPCGRLHGHSWKAVIYLKDEIKQPYGWVMDFGDIAKKFEPIREQLDHNYLNNIEGLENPTSEVIAKWVWDKLKPELEALSRVTIYETVDCAATYTGE